MWAGLLSTEMGIVRSAEAFVEAEGNTGCGAIGESWPGSAVSESPQHACTSDIGTWEGCASSRRIYDGTASGREATEADDVRRAAV